MASHDHEAEHIRRNRAAWNEWAAEFVKSGERDWAAADPSWGIWAVPEAELHVLPDDLKGLDAVELGCGTAYVSAWPAPRRPLRRHRPVRRAARHRPPPAVRARPCVSAA
jgi:hypothetical protein